MTQRESALAEKITPQMEQVAAAEKCRPKKILEGIANGKIALLANSKRQDVSPLGVGEGLRTKVNANIGTSPDFASVEKELEKLQVCLKAQTDTVMDLSTGGDLDAIRREIIKNSKVPLGTVPIYQAIVEAKAKKGSLEAMTADDIFAVIERHARDGVDFMTVHCGVTQRIVSQLKEKKRVMGIVSRGGAFLAEWILRKQKENPLYAYFDRLLEIAHRYDVVLSLGDGLRPGCLTDAGDVAQIGELKVLGKLAEEAWKAGVQVIIEGPGHVPYNEIEANVKLEKKLCKGAPFYVLGPLVTDIAPGYDHITAAIGGTAAAAAGADFLCYVTAAEHLGLPTLEEVKEGVITSRIAAHAADIVKGVPGAKEWDIELSKARRVFDWDKQIELSLDPEKAGQIHRQRNAPGTDVCTMCSEFCALKMGSQVFVP